MYSEVPQQDLHTTMEPKPQLEMNPLFNDGSSAYQGGAADKNGNLEIEISRYPPGDDKHGMRLLVSLGLMFITGCLSPLILRFMLTYVGHYSINISVTVPSAIFGVFSLVGYLQRSWSLGRAHSTTRPIGGGRWSFDYFHWNFTFGIIFVTLLITVANALKPPQTEIAALPLTILMIQVGAQLVIVQCLAAANVRYFCRISSMPRNSEVLRPALYTIIEDLVAVEGKQGTAWRSVYNMRYEQNASFRSLLARLSWIWGISSLVVAAIDMILIFKMKNVEISWIIGWSVPWVYAAIIAVPTYFMAKA